MSHRCDRNSSDVGLYWVGQEGSRPLVMETPVFFVFCTVDRRFAIVMCISLCILSCHCYTIPVTTLFQYRWFRSSSCLSVCGLNEPMFSLHECLFY